MHKENSFLTLTYSEDHLPHAMSLSRDDLNKFFDRLRKHLYPKRFRYFGAGEYGETRRPHYHVILFGHWFEDAELVNGKSYHSKKLEKLWGKGFINIGDVNYASAAYTAKYCMERPSKKQAEKDGTYIRVDPIGSNEYEVEAEFNVSSKRPGLGHEWIKKYWRDVFPADEVILLTEKGAKKKEPPNYYMDWLKENEPALWLEVKQKRNAKDQYGNPEQTESRLAVREMARVKASETMSKRKL